MTSVATTPAVTGRSHRHEIQRAPVVTIDRDQRLPGHEPAPPTARNLQAQLSAPQRAADPPTSAAVESIQTASPEAPTPITNGLLLPGPGGDALRAAVKASRQHDGRVSLDRVQRVVDMVPYVPNDVTSLTDFVSPGVNRSSNDLRLTPIGGEGHTGHSGADIYFVQDRNRGKKLGVLKIYPDQESFGNELSGMIRLQDADLRRVHGTAVMRAGQTDGGRPMTLMTCAPGDSLNDLTMNVRNAPDATAREAAWQTLKKAVGATAETLATLHSAAVGSGTQPPTDFIQHYVHELRNKSRELATHASALGTVHLTPEQVTDHVESTIRGLQDELAHGHVPNGLLHGDTHPGNFCYDSDSGVVTLIDMNRMQRSMDENGAPRGCPAFDVTKLPQRLGTLAQECGLSPTEAAELQTTFSDRYRQAGGPAIPQSVIDFFDMRSAVAGALRKLDSHNASESGLSDVAGTRLAQLSDMLERQSVSDTGIRNQLLKAVDDAAAGRMPHAVDSEVLSEHYPAIRDLLDRPLTPFDTPPLIAERQRQVRQRHQLSQQHLGQSAEIRTPEREALRDQIVEDLYGDPSTRACDHEAWVIIGGPGCGKSTLSRELERDHQALVIDGDAIRDRLPEFHQYELTDQVRDEKRALQARLRNQAADRGENVVLSFSPSSVEQVAGPIEALRRQGYTVHVALVSVPLEVGVARAAHRFDVTGRWSDCFDAKILDRRAEAVYGALRTQGVGNTFEAYANDIPNARPHRIADTDPLISPGRAA